MAGQELPANKINHIVQGDCIKGMNGLPAACVDLAFADPPFNIGYDYDVYDDRKERDQYLSWSKDWIASVHRVLKPDGTFWLAIGDEYAAELKLLSQEVGFHCRSWVIWYYTFGVNCKQKFSRSHAHLFHFVKDQNKYTFRSDDLDNRIYSARQLVYNDVRGNPTGRLPDDTWILRPQDLQDCFTPDEDTWYFPRVAGTFKERAGFHGCQMPEQLLARIVRFCSEERELVLDPFSGSATTLVAAKKLGRNYLGFELSGEYVARGQARMENIAAGDRLEGAPEPLVSAPLTRNGKSLVDVPGKRIRNKNEVLAPQQIPTAHEISRARLLFERGLLEAFAKVNEGYSLDRIIADPHLNAALAEECRRLGLAGETRTWNHALFNLRKRGRLAGILANRRTEISWRQCDRFLFASEIAWKQLVAEKQAKSLDEILCDPALAAKFDQIATSFAPEFESLQYRWAALKLRKMAHSARTRAKVLIPDKLQSPLRAFTSARVQAPETAGVYLVSDRNESLYVGEALNLKERFEVQFRSEQKAAWDHFCTVGDLEVQLFTSVPNCTDLLAYQSILIARYKPRLNSDLPCESRSGRRRAIATPGAAR